MNVNETITFNPIGAPEYFEVPVNGTYEMKLYGSQGGAFGRSNGGKGGYCSGRISLEKGEIIGIRVGTTTFNGPGSGLSKGGGATDIRRGGESLGARIIVAGGGGGGGTDQSGKIGGSGGGLAGGAGHSESSSPGGAGGTQTSGYALGVGETSPISSAGGGGGYWGGRAGSSNWTGGGGGSSYYGGMESHQVTISGQQTGSGLATITLIEKLSTNKYLFQDGEVVKKRDAILSDDTKDATPVMTAANAPAPYVVNASSNKSYISYLAWNLFAGSKWEAAKSSAWLSLDFGKQKVIKKYEVGCYLYNYGAPANFQFQGSNDNSNWVTLDTQFEVKWSTANEIKQFSLQNNNIPYRQYRIYVTATIGNGSLTLTNFLLHESTFTDVWLVVGAAPATKEMFDAHGMTDLTSITNEAIQQLVSDTPEFLCWTDEEAPEANAIYSSPTKTETASGQINEFSINSEMHYNSISSIKKVEVK